jgi:Flp pilus assembly protein TadG
VWHRTENRRAMPLTSNTGSFAGPTARRQLRRKGEHGSSLVEYAFILIIFLTLIFGISGFGHMLYVYHAVNNAAKEGTRWAAVNGANCGADSSCSAPASLAQIRTYVTTNLPATLDQSIVFVDPSWSAPSGSPPVCSGPVTGSDGTTVPQTQNYPGCTVSVQVSYPYSFYFPFLPASTTATLPCKSAGLCLSSTSELVIAH